jgi:hypothetical protein
MSTHVIQVREVWGSAEVARELGVAVTNLKCVAGLPEPFQKIRASRLWWADDIRPFAAEYHRRRGQRHAIAA